MDRALLSPSLGDLLGASESPGREEVVTGFRTAERALPNVCPTGHSRPWRIIVSACRWLPMDSVSKRQGLENDLKGDQVANPLSSQLKKPRPRLRLPRNLPQTRVRSLLVGGLVAL